MRSGGSLHCVQYARDHVLLQEELLRGDAHAGQQVDVLVREAQAAVVPH